MSEAGTDRSHMTIGISSFAPEDRRRLLDETLAYWEQAGPRAIWDATCELTAEWFLLRGIDPSTQRVEKTISGVLPVPWAKRGEGRGAREGRAGITGSNREGPVIREYEDAGP